MFGSIGYPELIVLGIVAVLLFGSRLPQVARSLGQSYREFRRGLDELRSNFDVDAPSDYDTPRLPDYHQADLDDQPAVGPRFDIDPEPSDVEAVTTGGEVKKTAEKPDSTG